MNGILLLISLVSFSSCGSVSSSYNGGQEAGVRSPIANIRIPYAGSFSDLRERLGNFAADEAFALRLMSVQNSLSYTEKMSKYMSHFCETPEKLTSECFVCANVTHIRDSK